MLKFEKPMLFILTEKHSNSYYLLTNRTQYVKLLHSIAEERLAAGWYEKADGDVQDDIFTDTSSQFAKISKILAMDQSLPAYQSNLLSFMNDRIYDGYEYEKFELVTFDERQ